MMAMLLINTERINDNDGYPVLSCADIEQLLSRFLPRGDVIKEEIIPQIEFVQNPDNTFFLQPFSQKLSKKTPVLRIC